MITRVEVIDHRSGGKGRILTLWNVAAEISMQDDGRTVKIFVTDPEPAAPDHNVDLSVGEHSALQMVLDTLDELVGVRERCEMFKETLEDIACGRASDESAANALHVAADADSLARRVSRTLAPAALAGDHTDLFEALVRLWRKIDNVPVVELRYASLPAAPDPERTP